MFQMHECSQGIHSIVVVLLRQMPNRQYTSLLCKMNEGEKIQWSVSTLVSPWYTGNQDNITYNTNISRKWETQYIDNLRKIKLFIYLNSDSLLLQRSPCDHINITYTFLTIYFLYISLAYKTLIILAPTTVLWNILENAIPICFWKINSHKQIHCCHQFRSNLLRCFELELLFGK